MNDRLAIRLIVDPPLDGAWNMAVDESLMRATGESPDSAAVVLRFYQWAVPTLSLGYFQTHSARQKHPPSSTLPMVRRSSGGGAIVHDLELTYSLTVSESAAASFFGGSKQLYVVMHETLRDALAGFGVQARLVTELNKELEKNFLCFSRRAPNDVLIAGHKVCGSAQRKKYDSISQHGSVIIGTSEFAPEIIGINEMSGLKLAVSDLREQWQAGIASSLGSVPVLSTLGEKEMKWAQDLCEGKFATVKWNSKR